VQPADQDLVMDELLRRALSESRASTACVEADEVAAWVDGGLQPAEAAAVEAHVSSCARCQAMMATLVRTAPVVSAPGIWARILPGRTGRGVRWLVPVAGVAAALAVYVATRPEAPAPALESIDSRVAQSESSVADGRLLAGPASEPAEALPSREGLDKDASAPPASPAAPSGTTSPAAGPTTAEAVRDRLSAPAPDAVPPGSIPQVAAAPPAPAAPPVAAAAPAPRVEAREGTAARLGDVTTVVGTGTNRWRITGGRVEYSNDDGTTWRQTSGVTRVVAGAAAAVPDAVCWMVGPEGAVFVTVDGSRFSRVASPAAIDLTRVVASDGQTATVFATDGRAFTTRDQGATWALVP
jgi:hypothetical protein